jgi:hypothetical protein
MADDSDTSDGEDIRQLAQENDDRPVERIPRKGRKIAYERTLDCARTAWRQYVEFSKIPHDPENPYACVPTEKQYCAFLLYCTKFKKGHLNKKITAASLIKYMHNVATLFKRETGLVLAGVKRANIINYIHTTCVAKGASTAARARPVATMDVVLDLHYFLWARDTEMMHPRMRLQMSCLMLIMAYHGCRPGAIVESSCHGGSNEGVYYKDLTIKYILSEGSPRMVVDVRYRYQKGSRGIAKKELSIPLLEDRDLREACPVTQLMALAILDGALVDVETVDDLARFLPSPQVPVKTIHIRETHHDKPVFRSTPCGTSISDTRILRAAAVLKMFPELGSRAGYKDKFLPYCIRRAHGQAIDSKRSALFLTCRAYVLIHPRLSFLRGTASANGSLQ